MAGGQKINDHKSWIGSGSDGTVFPAGAKMKRVDSDTTGFGGLSQYEDTNEKIVAQQKMNTTKVHGHPQKAGYRN
jgi:hypothetical protein